MFSKIRTLYIPLLYVKAQIFTKRRPYLNIDKVSSLWYITPLLSVFNTSYPLIKVIVSCILSLWKLQPLRIDSALGYSQMVISLAI